MWFTVTGCAGVGGGGLEEEVFGWFGIGMVWKRLGGFLIYGMGRGIVLYVRRVEGIFYFFVGFETTLPTGMKDETIIE